MTDRPTCATCRWFDEKARRCHKFPPQVVAWKEEREEVMQGSYMPTGRTVAVEWDFSPALAVGHCKHHEAKQ